MSDGKPVRRDENLFVGVILIGVGLLFLLDRLDVYYIGSIWKYWPFILVAFGVYKVILAQSAEKVGSGVWLAFIGCWLYVSLERVWDLGFGDTWPALVIAWGIGMIWRSVGRPWPLLRKEQSS